ncbi:Inner membrane transport protein RhmT [Ralstonia pickettii]|jgi:D-galactonate transporter|uniref:MFS transporter n=1 Tax=Ralstonia TaxID=48736 RepID=UPI0001E69BFC|nr:MULTISPECIES: MFS transporter [Ralstonia]EFP68043.1 transporter, major facilitator family protein [Ralstonia pickettii]EGY61555.1 D-galactonate transporter [Ralstonia sp. 5_2_56FAA]MBU6525382.1 MFS transporter [Ralstonia sp. B265]NPT52164.1 MFS transporter [Ralstonia sp. 3N]QQK37983.1 Putative metabolite transport protein NicT [Ralstonia pickettii]
MLKTAHGGEAAIHADLEEAAYTKVTLRLIPFLFLCYVFAYLDRVNVGFAKLQMLSDLKFSETIYGLGAGIFFIGYFLMEVPSNLALHRFGARKWIARIMISWGILSAAMIFVKTPTAFYVLRFLLGVAEAGFFPGIILYLTYWYPASRRSKVTALFMTGIPIAGVVGGPLSGWILDRFHNVNGMHEWQWLFLLEAIPSLVAGVVTFFYLDDRIRDAKWLDADEKAVLERELASDSGKIEVHNASGAFTNARVWVLCACYFGIIMGLYGISFWLPTLIKASGVTSAFDVGLLTMIPYGAAAVAMVMIGRSSDRTKERRWHVALPAIVGAVGLTASTFVSHQPAMAVLALTFATIGILGALCQFWSIPPAFLGGAAAAAGIALINSVGNLAGFVSPYLVGWIKDATNSTDLGLYCVAASLIAAAAIVLTVPKKVVNR